MLDLHEIIYESYTRFVLVYVENQYGLNGKKGKFLHFFKKIVYTATVAIENVFFGKLPKTTYINKIVYS